MSAGTVSIQLVLPALVRAKHHGVAVDDLLAHHALSSTALEDPDTRIAFESGVALWDAIAARVGTPDFGLAAARDLAERAFDLHDYLVRCSPTLGDGLRRAFRFLALISSHGSFEVEMHGDEMRVVNRPPAATSRHAHEFALLTVLLMVRRAAGQPLAMTRLELMWREPADTVALREAFACPIVFGCVANVLVFPARDEALALPARDDRLIVLMERHATSMIAKQLGDAHAPLRDRVRRAIVHLLQREAMTLDGVARHLGTSARSLQRQLRGEGRSFRDLVDDVRREIAIAQVAAGHTPITTIALLLDFSDASAFHRSFRRWTGQSPSEFRVAAATRGAARSRS